ncbi:hypothetical protein [Kribbella sp. NPDC000426]|uniref:hypothetical protein n=1 Tax=Kribbella sp. NPDC000426 TaxID=3154255 RepID=UPI00332B8074
MLDRVHLVADCLSTLSWWEKILHTATHGARSPARRVMRSSRIRPADLNTGLAKVVRVMHNLRTCRIPLSVVSAYYQRNLDVRRGPTRPVAWDREVFIGIGDTGIVEVWLMESAAHVAYLEPRSGTGLLVMPPRDTDISAEEGFTGIPWPAEWSDCPGAGMSLQSADLVRLLDRLATSGWTLLEDRRGDAEVAGQAAGGGPAVCLFAVRTSFEHLVLEDLHQALTALHAAADLRHVRH